MKSGRKLIILLLITIVFAFCSNLSAEKVEPKIEIKAKPFDLKQVRLLDGPFKDAQDAMHKYLLELESNRLLHMFRVNAGLPSDAQPLGGWESPTTELRGHSMGHYLSGCALMYSATGDEKLKQKAERIVAELAKCQKALGDSGYLSAYPESFIERAEKTERVWAPYYTLHKIYAGLLDMYVHCQSEQALEVAMGMVRWVENRTDRLTPEQIQNMLDHTEQGGMNEALCNIYAVTGEPEILKVARRFDQNSYTEPLYRKEDNMTGQHVNSFIPNIIGTAREYELTGNKKEYDIAANFWDQVANHRSYATGGTSNHERWITKADILADQLSPNTHETCCTYNILKLTRHLFTWEPKAEFADFYERGLYNGILSTIRDDNAMTMYYVPLKSGLYKTFSTPRNSFWCCTGTGMENPGKYGDSIYFYDDEGIFVNLFIASVLNYSQKGVTIRQETKFPEQEGFSLIISTENEKAVPLNIRIRVPYWAQNGVTVLINGKAQSVNSRPESYISLKRDYKDGDTIEVKMPMSLHLHPMPDDKSIAAFMYGPLVLAAELGDKGLTEQIFYGSYAPPDNPVDVPVMDSLNKDIDQWIEPLAGDPLRFHTVNTGWQKDVTLIPFYKLFDQRYAIYFKLYDQQGLNEYQNKIEEKAAREKELRERIIDSVSFGGSNISGSEKEHKFDGQDVSRGSYQDKNWVQANPGGWLSYELKCLEDDQTFLMCTYWGADVGNRQFDIYVNDQKIASQRIHELSPGQFIDIDYEIPIEITRGKNTVTVKFMPQEGNIAGGIFGIATLKAK